MVIEQEALLILNAIPGLTARRIRLLCNHFGSAGRVLLARRKELSHIGILSNPCIEQLMSFDRDNFLKTEMGLMAEHNVQPITMEDYFYPQDLAEISDPPVVLYVKGSLKLAGKRAMALVGSRQASLYGLQMARELAERLGQMGFPIVSGLARGIDTAAHRGCLHTGMRTYAVLGCGLAHRYPPQNAKLMDEIAANGAVLSEFSMSMPPLARNFPQRNRIISGLSLGVVVVEAGRNSGALITSRFALEQGREVFAVPGRLGDANTYGTHRLIQQGAKLITGVEDILDEIPLAPENPIERRTDLTRDSVYDSRDEAFVLNALDRPLGIDDLIKRTGKPSAEMLKLLFTLELRRKVRRMPGMHFERI